MIAVMRRGWQLRWEREGYVRPRAVGRRGRGCCAAVACGGFHRRGSGGLCGRVRSLAQGANTAVQADDGYRYCLGERAVMPRGTGAAAAAGNSAATCTSTAYDRKPARDARVTPSPGRTRAVVRQAAGCGKRHSIAGSRSPFIYTIAVWKMMAHSLVIIACGARQRFSASRFTCSVRLLDRISHGSHSHNSRSMPARGFDTVCRTWMAGLGQTDVSVVRAMRISGGVMALAGTAFKPEANGFLTLENLICAFGRLRSTQAAISPNATCSF